MTVDAKTAAKIATVHTTKVDMTATTAATCVPPPLLRSDWVEVKDGSCWLEVVTLAVGGVVAWS